MAPLSPNSGERRGGARASLVVLHYTAMQDCAAALARLCDPATEVSAHYLIAEDGALHALVDESRRAWHAGAGAWGTVTDVNSHSIGIELANTGRQPFAHPQMQRLEVLLADLLSRHAIPAARVIAHADMAPGRKTDPGRRFDWRRLAQAGLSVWPGEGGARDADFFGSARAFGYPDASPAAVLHSFRLRFRPWAEGPEDATDRAMIAALARDYPVMEAQTRADR